MVIVTVQNQIIRILEVLVISAISFEFDKYVVEANNISQNVFCCCRHLVRIPAILRIPDFRSNIQRDRKLRIHHKTSLRVYKSL